MNILVIAPDFPYPPNHGGRADVWKRINLLIEQGHTVDLLCTVNEDSAKVDDVAFVRSVLRDVFFVRRSYSLRLAFHFRPFQAMSRFALRRFRPRADYDFVLFESEYVAEALVAFDGNPAKKILRVHNDEAEYFRSLHAAADGLKQKLYYFTEALKFPRYSRWVKRSCDAILHISHKEFLRDTPGEFAAKTMFFPPHVSADQLRPPKEGQGLTALFVGNLFTDNNVAGLRWYVEHVHPLVLQSLPGYRLVVAGNSRGNAPSFLREPGSSIVFHESPASLDDFYASSGVFINPMRSGAGVKIKTVNAIEQGVPVVSTGVGAEGIGLKHDEDFLCAETAQDFARAVASLLLDDRKRMALAKNAQRYIRENFDNSLRLKQLQELFVQVEP